MAKITLRISAQEIGETNVSDAKLQAQVGLALSAWDGPINGTISDQLSFVADRLRGYLLEVAKGEKRRQRQAAADALGAQDAADLGE